MPYRVLEAIPFKMPYLSGFRAEIRNLETDALEPVFQDDIHKYTENLLRDTVTGYDSVYNSSLDSDVKRKDYQYALFPVLGPELRIIDAAVLLGENDCIRLYIRLELFDALRVKPSMYC